MAVIMPEFLSQTTNDPESGQSPDDRPEVPLDEVVRRAVDALDAARRAAAELARRAALAERDR